MMPYNGNNPNNFPTFQTPPSTPQQPHLQHQQQQHPNYYYFYLQQQQQQHQLSPQHQQYPSWGNNADFMSTPPPPLSYRQQQQQHGHHLANGPAPPPPPQMVTPRRSPNYEDLRLIQMARQGFSQFQSDYGDGGGDGNAGEGVGAVLLAATARQQQQQRQRHEGSGDMKMDNYYNRNVIHPPQTAAFMLQPQPPPGFFLQDSRRSNNLFQQQDHQFPTPGPSSASFGVDEELLEDHRPLRDLTNANNTEKSKKNKPYRLFEDRGMSEMMRRVYNVNCMDTMLPLEISSNKLFPRSVERWPIDVYGYGKVGFSELRSQVLMFGGGGGGSSGGFGGGGGSGGTRKPLLSTSSSSSGSEATVIACNANKGATSTSSSVKPEVDHHQEDGDNATPKSQSSASNTIAAGSSSNNKIDAYGLQSLARFMGGEGVEENPMGFLTFCGMNLHKLMKDLDKKEPITGSFAGPFVEHNFSLDYCGIGATKFFWEYEFRGDDDTLGGGGGGREGGSSGDGCRMRSLIKIKRSLFPRLSFEILAFIFYTQHGDALQLLAAEEIYNRGWRYHKTFQVWLSPWKKHPDGKGGFYYPPIEPGYEPSREHVSVARHDVDDNDEGYDEDGGGGGGGGGCDEERMVGWGSGVYIYFHYGRWAFDVEEFRIVSEDGILEGRPQGFGEALWD